MPKTTEPTVTPADICFELDQFERSDGWLRLSGRWFGVRGRRFVRPTLTVAVDGERVRALADLEDKPWPAEDGRAWTASFPLRQDGRIAKPELSVAPDITIELPAPSGKRGRAQRLSALPRRDAMTASWGDLAAVIESPTPEGQPSPEPEDMLDGKGGEAVAEQGAEADEPSAPGAEAGQEADPAVPAEEAPEDEIERLRTRLAEAEETISERTAELESARAGLGSARAELGSARAGLESAQAQLAAAAAEVEEARRQLGLREDESAAAQAELAAARSAREAALRNAAQAEAEKEEALTRRAEAEAERDALAAEKAQLTTELEQSQGTLERLGRERDEAVTSRGAALVMRGATQAMPAHERHVGWVRRALAVLIPLAAIIGILIAVGVL